MNGKILNSPIRPARTLKDHHIRHMISGTLVFFLGIAANEAIMHIKRHWPKKVRWSSTEVQANYTVQTGLPATNVEFDLGMAEDGSLVWRPKKQ